MDKQQTLTREYCKSNPTTLYIFTDNSDRNSGQNLIDPNSWYAKKYGQGHHYPNFTTAVCRGLDNAYPICTQKYYHKGAKGSNGRWNDSDYDEFVKIIEDEITDITNALKSGKYREIVFCNSVLNGYLSAITMERVPKLYKYLKNRLNTFTKIYLHKEMFK